ncbi:MAG TPA: hypothetical protein VK914_03305 [bacterium]|nr:hypothetical protein [bacterium]
MILNGLDCSPLEPQPKGHEEVDWLKRLIVTSVNGANVVAIGGERGDDEPIAYCAPDGVWWAGRYVGTVLFDGGRLTIRPRFGIAVLRDWLSHATNVALVEAPGHLTDDESFIVQLLAAVWTKGFVDAARHGLPALKTDSVSQGAVVRGRLDVGRSVRLIAGGDEALVSIRRERSLDHAASRSIVAAYDVLRRWMGGGNDSWIPPRVKELLPHLAAVTGARPRIPTKAELGWVRYTPITAGFASVADLSHQIATRRGLSSAPEADGRCQGVLLDVAELWELYVLSILRQAERALTIRHGTRELKAAGALLESEVNNTSLGFLRPDALVEDHGSTVGVLDAKYKRLHPKPAAPLGPQREDLYQLAAYMARFGRQAPRPWGMLVYPVDPVEGTTPPAESLNPWRLDQESKVLFVTLPHKADQAKQKLRTAIQSLKPQNLERSAA